MPAAVALAFGASFLLVLIAAVASPEWSERREIRSRARERPALARPQARAVFALVVFGILVGLASALGLVPGTLLLPLGGLMASMAGRRYLSGAPAEGIASGAAPWFVVIAWATSAVAFGFRTADLPSIHAAQASLGPALLTGPPLRAAAVASAAVAGLAAAVLWTEALPRIAGATDVLLRWGETALAAALVAATAFGPSVGALSAGPLDLRAVGAAGASFGATCAAVAAASFCRRFLPRLSTPPLMWGLLALSLAALTTAAWTA